MSHDDSYEFMVLRGRDRPIPLVESVEVDNSETVFKKATSALALNSQRFLDLSSSKQFHYHLFIAKISQV